MENKYYVPKIEELYIGYECEACFTSYGGYAIFDFGSEKEEDRFHMHEPEDKEAAKHWSKYVIEEQKGNPLEDNIQRSIDTAMMILKDKRLRIKYLDQGDIESEGWIHTGGQMISDDRQDYEKGGYIMQHFKRHNEIRIGKREDDTVLGNYSGFAKILYDGKCPSINEFRKIMNWVHITK